MPPDFFPPTAEHGARQRGFVIVNASTSHAGLASHGGQPAPPAFRNVVGFRNAVLAADPRAPAPPRLDLAGPDDEAAAWLSRWAEDVDQVRRRLTVRRFDAVEVTVVATLASFGEGIATSLAVESIRARAGGAILRSGVHPRAEVDAALALAPADLP